MVYEGGGWRRERRSGVVQKGFINVDFRNTCLISVDMAAEHGPVIELVGR